MPSREQVYLLDVQIHDIYFDYVKELSCLDDRQEFKILAHFLGYDPVMVYDNIQSDFKATPILFKMNPDELVKAMDRNPLTLSVLGKLDERREYTIGTIKVLFTEDFADAVISAKTSTMYPVTTQLDSPFNFRNLYHEESGYVNVYLKLSCFGSIDIRTVCTYDKADGQKEPNMTEKSPETMKKSFSPTMTDKDGIVSAVPFLEKSDKSDIHNLNTPVSWSMTKDEFSPVYEPAPRSPMNRANESNYESKQNADEFTLQCTCDMPDFPGQRPQTLTLKCQCAEILAAMKSCFPDQVPDMTHSKSPAPVPATPTTNQPAQAPTPSAAAPAEKKPETDVSQRPVPAMSSAKPSTQVQSVAIKTASKDVIPTSNACGSEKKVNGSVFRSSSEENTKVHKPDVKSVVSNIDVSSPEVKVEDPSKKVASVNQLNLEKKKEVVKKTMKNKKNKNKKDIYEYTAGMYPGMVIGHRSCIPAVRLVPKNMGWMWNLLNIFGSARHSKGWRPGAMVKTVAKNFGSWNKAAGFQGGEDAETFLNFKRKKKEGGETVVPHTIKPTLHVHKKDKFYHITVNPPGDSNVKPITFKVDPRKGSSDEETSSESTTDDSFEFEYTVPAGLLPPPKKVEFTNATTQYLLTDFQPKRKVEVPVPTEEPAAEKKEEPKKPANDKKKGKKGK